MPNLLERGVFPPACCHFCATPTRLVDLEKETVSTGRAYLCMACLREAGAVLGFVPKDDIGDLVRRNAEAMAQLDQLERHAADLGRGLSEALQTAERQERELELLRSERSATINWCEARNRDLARWRREVAPQELLTSDEIEAREREAFAAAMAARPDEDEEDGRADDDAHHDHVEPRGSDVVADDTKPRRQKAGAGKEG